MGDNIEKMIEIMGIMMSDMFKEVNKIKKWHK